MTMPRRTRSAAETRAVGESLARELAPDGLLLVSGELGAGKTVLTQGIAAGLGIDANEVVSPTFTLIQEYGSQRDREQQTHGRGSRLIHVDLYRLAPDEVWELGLDELFAGPGVKVVEWPERLPFDPPGARWIEIRPASEEDAREIVERSPSSRTAR